MQTNTEKLQFVCYFLLSYIHVGLFSVTKNNWGAPLLGLAKSIYYLIRYNCSGPILSGEKKRLINNQVIWLEMSIFTYFRYLRAVAYGWFVRWICGPMGWENSRPLSACVYHRIRNELPSGRSRGYTPAEERPWALPWFNKCVLYIHKTCGIPGLLCFRHTCKTIIHSEKQYKYPPFLI